MSERKVLNKYYPPDFDVTKLPKLRLSRDRQFVIRIMAPFSMRCKTCGDYIYKGRKFNARQETVKDETYLGLRIFRFYIRCPKCLSEITFKTDPENTDYTMEQGAIRNFEAFRLAKKQEEKLKQEKEDEELNNPMKALENRTMESRSEMQMIEKLEELKDLNARHAAVDHEKLLRDHIIVNEEEQISKQEEEDEALVKSIFNTRNDGYVKRIDDFDKNDDDDDDYDNKGIIDTHNKESDLTRKRSATDHLAEKAEDDVPAHKKKLQSKEGVVGFSKIKLASVVKIKKPKESDKKLSTDNNYESKDINAGEAHCSKSTADSSSSVVSDSIDPSTSTKQTTNSLSLLGTYDSSSNSDSDQ